MNKSLWLIFAGVLLIKLTILNMLFGFPSTLFEYIAAEQSGLLAPSESLLPVAIAEMEDRPQIGENSAYTQSESLSLGVVEPAPQKSLAERTSQAGFVPDRIEIPSIQLDAPVIPAAEKTVEIQNQWFEQWIAPDEFAAGWQANSAPLGVAGNTVLNGHHNMDGKVFGKLVYTKVGDSILVYSGKALFEYKIAEIKVLREKNAPLATRQKNAEWISTTSDERLTLVTCWPKRTNTHRLIVVAYPVTAETINSNPQNTQ